MPLPTPQLPRRQPSILTIVLLVGGLYLARDLLIPFALAALLAPVLTPPIALLERCRLGRVVAVLIVVVLTCAVLGVVVWFVTQQVADLVTRMPDYKAHIIDKIDSLRGGVIEKATDAVKQLEKGIATSQPPGPDAPAMDVRVVADTPSGFDAVMSKLGLLFGPLGTLGVVLVIATFLLLQRGDLRDRIVHLIGEGKVNLTTQAMGEMSTRVGKYLRMQATINCLHGTVIGLGLFFLGVPNALVWGLLAMLLRFVPYVGPLASMLMPFALSLAVFDGWEWPLTVAGFLVAVELLTANVLEPWLYGNSAGVSPLAVIVSAVFWAWLWGPIGMVMAMPLTVVLVVIGKHVPQLHFLNVLLGDETRTHASIRIYQRLLATDQNDLSDIAESELAERGSFVQLCDDVLIPALGMVQFDRQHGSLPEFCERFIERAMRELIDDLGEQSREMKPIAAAAAAVGTPATRVLCVPTRNELDELVCLMLRQALENVGIRCEVVAADAMTNDKTERVAEAGVDLVCISALPPTGLVQARYLAKRLRNRLPGLEIVVGLWGSELPPESGAHSMRLSGPSGFVTTLAAARQHLQESAHRLVAPATVDSRG